jgi:hypothetical protein
MGGRGAEEARLRASTDAVKDAQTAWQRLSPIDGPEARALASRFRDACRRVLDRTRRSSPSAGSTAPPRRREEEEVAV